MSVPVGDALPVPEVTEIEAAKPASLWQKMLDEQVNTPAVEKSWHESVKPSRQDASYAPIEFQI